MALCIDAINEPNAPGICFFKAIVAGQDFAVNVNLVLIWMQKGDMQYIETGSIGKRTCVCLMVF